MKWWTICNVHNGTHPLYICKKLCWILFGIVLRFRTFYRTHLMHWCGRLKIWNEHCVKNICVFVCDIDTMFNRIAVHKSSGNVCFLFRSESRRKKAAERMFKVNIPRILSFALKFKKEWKQTKMKNCAATNLNFPFDETNIFERERERSYCWKKAFV